MTSWRMTGLLGALAGVAFMLAVAPVAAQRDPAMALRPLSAQHRGELVAVDGVEKAIRGKTLTIVQPWAGLDRYELREFHVYFRPDGMADSRLWIGEPWTATGPQLCLTDRNLCYRAMRDESGQAFVVDMASGLTAKVTRIAAGDVMGMRADYEARQARRAAEARLATAVLGLVFGGVLGGGGGAAPPSYDYVYREATTAPPPSQPSYTPPIGGERGLYGSCQNLSC
jgi:hypothetical protein